MRRFGVQLIIAVLVLPFGPAALANTEAEVAAQSERALTASEIERLNAECPLPETGQTLAGFPQALHVVRVDLPAQRFLPLVALSPPDGAEESQISRWDDLPKGGIGRRDYCDGVSLTKIPETKDEQNMVIYALRLRPQLELQKNYPAAYAEMMQRDQYVLMGPGNFAYIALESPEQAKGIMSDLAGNAAFPTEGLYFTMGNGLYIQLRE